MRDQREMSIADVNGTRIAYEDRGEGPALLFLHGFGLDRRMWRAQLPLAKHHRVIAFDSRGFGASAMPGDEPFKHCEDAAALCAHVGVKQVVAIGHSIGAHHLLELALTRPDLVVGSISICASGLAGVPFPPEILETFAGIRAVTRPVLVPGGIAAAKAIWRRCGWFRSAGTRPALAAELDAIHADYTGWHWTHENPVESVSPPLAERLPEITMPALVVTGDDDLVYNETIGDRLCAGLPAANRLRLPGVGHLPNMEAPASINHAISAFVTRLGPSPR